MSDNDLPPGSNNQAENQPDDPVRDLGEFTLPASEELAGRVHRSINRRVLAADTLDFSLRAMILTVWDYFKAIMEAFPGPKPPDQEN